MMLVPRSKVAVTLPLPPSVNNLFATVGGKRVRSKAYARWIKNVSGLLLELERPQGIPVVVHVDVFGTLNRARDLDNMLKPIGDALVTCNVLPGDSVKHVVGWRILYWPSEEDAEPGLTVRLYPDERS